MRVPLSRLREFVEFDLTPDQLAELRSTDPEALVSSGNLARSDPGAVERWASGMTDGRGVLRQVERWASGTREEGPVSRSLGSLVGRTARWAFHGPPAWIRTARWAFQSPGAWRRAATEVGR